MYGVDPRRGHHEGHQGQGQPLDLLDTGTHKGPASNLGSRWYLGGVLLEY